MRFSYKKRGLCEEQIERYLQYFDRNQLMIIESVKFLNETRKVMSDISHF